MLELLFNSVRATRLSYTMYKCSSYYSTVSVQRVCPILCINARVNIQQCQLHASVLYYVYMIGLLFNSVRSTRLSYTMYKCSGYYSTVSVTRVCPILCINARVNIQQCQLHAYVLYYVYMLGFQMCNTTTTFTKYHPLRENTGYPFPGRI